jgi:hypothetical protein
MTFTFRGYLCLLIGGAVLAHATFAPLEIHIGDGLEKVDSALGKRFEKADAIKMTDSTRLYKQADGKVCVAFKDQKVCLLYYIRPFTEAEALALLAREAPADQWKLDRTAGTMRFYRTVDDRLVAHISDQSVIVSTREVDY